MFFEVHLTWYHSVLPAPTRSLPPLSINPYPATVPAGVLGNPSPSWVVLLSDIGVNNRTPIPMSQPEDGSKARRNYCSIAEERTLENVKAGTSSS